MPAGTITLTNNSAIVKGTGTAFNTELKAGDFIVSVVGGVTYTLPVKTMDSATQATLIKAYDGPTQAGAAWYAVPREMQNSITAQLVSEATKAMRGMNYDKANWQQFFTADGDVTITLPDNSQSTGPSAKKLINSVVDKADKTEVDKKANKSDLGDSASRNVGSGVGTVAAGDDKRLNTVEGKSGGKINGGIGIAGTVIAGTQGTYLSWNESGTGGEGSIVVNSGSGVGGFKLRIVNEDNSKNKAIFDFYSDGAFQATGGVYSVGSRVRAFTGANQTYLEAQVDGATKGINFFDSDEILKERIKDVEKGNATDDLRLIRPVSYKFKDTSYKENGEAKVTEGKEYSYGVIAQEIIKIIPDSVNTLSNGNMALDPLSVIGFLLAVNKEMLEQIDQLKDDVKNLKDK